MLKWIWGLVAPEGRPPTAGPGVPPAALRNTRAHPELTDDDLQDVVGGLERSYVDRPLAESR
jgi:hypothetical protein